MLRISGFMGDVIFAQKLRLLDVAARLDQSAPNRFAGLLSGAQRLECDDVGKQAVGMLPRWNSLLSLSLGYSAANFLVPRILVHEDALANGLSDDVTWNINYRRI